MRKKLSTILLTAFASIGMLATPVYADDSYSVSTASGTWNKVSEEYYTMDIDGDGKTDVTLTKNGNTWTYQFNVSKANQDYYVYEEMMEELENKGYTVSGSDGSEGTRTDPGIIKGTNGDSTYTLTNSKKHDKQTYGSLKITKKVEDLDGTPAELKETNFTFTITLIGDTEELQKKIKGNHVFGDVAFKDGVGKITLSKDKSVTISDLPTGIKYSIEEEPVETFTPEWSGDKEGYIVADSTTSITCTNKLHYVLDKSPGSFTIKKKVDAIAEDMNDSYTFHVSLEGLTSKNQYNYTKYDSTGTQTGSTSFSANSSGTAVVDFTLKNNESVKFSKLMDGTTYQITEDAGKYVSSYKIVEQIDEEQGTGDGTITKTSDQSTQSNQALNTAVETVESLEDALITFTNKYEYTQSLKITKKTAQQGLLGMTDLDSDKKFEMTIEFSDMEPGTFFDSTIGAVRADEDGEATKTFNIKNGESVEFTDMPENVKYKITETGTEDWVGSYQMTGQKVVVKSSDNGGVSNDVSTEEETVDRGENVTIEFTNYKPLVLPATGGIGIGAISIGGACLVVVANKKRKGGNR